MVRSLAEGRAGTDVFGDAIAVNTRWAICACTSALAEGAHSSTAAAMFTRLWGAFDFSGVSFSRNCAPKTPTAKIHAQVTLEPPVLRGAHRPMLAEAKMKVETAQATIALKMANPRFLR